jgi:hypothetical protein
MYGQGRVLLGLWCFAAGLVFSKTWIKIGDGSLQLSAQFLWPPTAHGTSQTGINHFYSSIYGSNKQHCMDKEESYWVCGVVQQGWFSAKLGSKLVTDPISCQHNFCGHQQHMGHHKQESTTFILPYMDPTNSIVWTRKSLIGSVVSYSRVGFQQNLGQIP